MRLQMEGTTLIFNNCTQMRTGCLSCPRKRRLTDLDRTNPYPQVLPTSQKKKRNKTKQKQNKTKQNKKEKKRKRKKGVSKGYYLTTKKGIPLDPLNTSELFGFSLPRRRS